MNLTGLRLHQRPRGGQLDSAPCEEADAAADDDGNEGRKPANRGREEVKSFEPSSSFPLPGGAVAKFPRLGSFACNGREHAAREGGTR